MTMEKNKVMDEVLGDTPDITTSDLYSADFRTAFRGFDKGQVAAFLERAADSFENLQRQVAELKKTVSEQKSEIATYRALEQSLSEALATAQRMSETTLDQARREADLIQKEAQQLLENARRQVMRVPESMRDEVLHLRAARKRLKADLRAVLDIHSALLRGDNDSNLELLEFLPADGAAYLNIGDGHGGGSADGDDPDVAIIEHDGGDRAAGSKEDA